MEIYFPTVEDVCEFSQIKESQNATSHTRKPSACPSKHVLYFLRNQDKTTWLQAAAVPETKQEQG
jgi:hypothetical protein